MRMLEQGNELELCRGGKCTETNYAATTHFRAFAIFSLTMEEMVNLPEIRHLQIKRSLTGTLRQI